ncbi:MAG: T9SS type A sorting domain-containing protein, partial [Vicingaceae bacterium]|nr:T9SS type A sorting domain-containing protein [Vicingaceae bacterium]
INNMRFEFDVNARLIVENGARLTINGTTLTVYNDCGGDNLMWLGVEVWGIGTGTFQPAVSGRFIAQNSSIIEHAIEGAVNFKHATSANNGGIIQANTGTTFRNNYRDVVFNPFQSVFGSSQLNDQSYFSDVTFITDASLNNPSLNNSIIHATLNEVTGITFSGCDFENTDVSGTVYPYTGRGQGIVSYTSKFTVQARCANMTIPCSVFDESNFTNLTDGIVALNTIRTKVAFINKTNFNNNFKSIFIFNMDAAKITENDFDIGASVSPSNFSYGLYLWNCSGYTVENNNFTSSYGGYVGVYVNNSGTAANEIYRNDFSNLVVGSQAANTNGDNIGNGVGLEFRCNNYESIVDYDILISSGMVADDHGNCLTATGPSNNDFSYTAQYGDFWAETSSLGVPTYRYSPNSSNLEPRNGYFNILNTAKQECINLPTFNYNNSCPNRQGGGGIFFPGNLAYQETQYDSINDLMTTSSKDTSLLKTLEQDLAVVKSQMQRTRSYIMQDMLLNSKNSDGKLEVIDFLKQHAAYNTNADEQLLTGLYIATGNIGAAQSKIAQLQSKPNNGQFAEFSNITITLKQHPKQNKALLKDSVLLEKVKDLANHPNENSAVASARALLISLGLATYEETIEVVIPTSSKARLANDEETKTTNKDSFVNVFPNPANDNLTISHNLATKDGAISLEIMDVMGRVLLNKTINSTNNQIDINQLSSGLYFYNVLQNDKMVQSGKLVVE